MAVIVPRRLRSETVGRHGVFDLERHQVADPTPQGHGSPYEVMCLRMPDWVTIVPFTPEHRVVLIYQYRHGVGETMLETPGGVVEPDESVEQAAARELLEETGFRAENLRALGCVHPNPAFQNNRLHMLAADGAVFVGQEQVDEHEHTETVVLDWADALERLRRGEVQNALSALALERALRSNGHGGPNGRGGNGLAGKSPPSIL